ncbi:MAG: hypothetical protein IJ493_10420 [Clostridia bacterium]|nr:hypothetical protein [Clostridia bacterium]
MWEWDNLPYNLRLGDTFVSIVYAHIAIHFGNTYDLQTAAAIDGHQIARAIDPSHRYHDIALLQRRRHGIISNLYHVQTGRCYQQRQ